MEGSVSNLEVCNFAYAGKFDQLKQSILSDKSLATKTDQDHRTALHWACSAGHTDIVQFLLNFAVDVNLKDDACWTPLHIAASAGREEIVRALISRGADLNPVNQNGCTPLHYAASKDRYEIALILLENGADPNATDKLDSTPLHRASAKGNYRLIQLLLKQSASTNIQDSQGNTALMHEHACFIPLLISKAFVMPSLRSWMIFRNFCGHPIHSRTVQRVFLLAVPKVFIRSINTEYRGTLCSMHLSGSCLKA
uniref:Proteasome 26S subunit, non-ATPase 10 n=1 Tax=Paramormyrops kingsleyae TaxID=1676925 RepID=A0A3B3QIJ7_9TELE